MSDSVLKNILDDAVEVAKTEHKKEAAKKKEQKKKDREEKGSNQNERDGKRKKRKREGEGSHSEDQTTSETVLHLRNQKASAACAVVEKTEAKLLEKHWEDAWQDVILSFGIKKWTDDFHTVLSSHDRSVILSLPPFPEAVALGRVQLFNFRESATAIESTSRKVQVEKPDSRVIEDALGQVKNAPALREKSVAWMKKKFSKTTQIKTLDRALESLKKQGLETLEWSKIQWTPLPPSAKDYLYLLHEFIETRRATKPNLFNKVDYHLHDKGALKGCLVIRPYQEGDEPPSQSIKAFIRFAIQWCADYGAIPVLFGIVKNIPPQYCDPLRLEKCSPRNLLHNVRLYDLDKEAVKQASMFQSDYMKYLQTNPERNKPVKVTFASIDKDHEIKEEVKELSNSLLYAPDVDIMFANNPVYKQFCERMLLKELLPGGSWCLDAVLPSDSRTLKDALLLLGPGGVGTNGHIDGKGVANSFHYNAKGYNEIFITRPLSPAENLLVDELFFGYWYQDEDDKDPKTTYRRFEQFLTAVNDKEFNNKIRWPSNKLIQLMEQLGTIVLPPGASIIILAGCYHAFRKMELRALANTDCHYELRSTIIRSYEGKSKQAVFPKHCISFAHDFEFLPPTADGIKTSLSSLLKCIKLGRVFKVAPLASLGLCTFDLARAARNDFFEGMDQHQLLEGILPTLQYYIEKEKADLKKWTDVSDQLLRSKTKLAEADKPKISKNRTSFRDIAEPNSHMNYFFCADCSCELWNLYLFCDECAKNTTEVDRKYLVCLQCAHEKAHGAHHARSFQLCYRFCRPTENQSLLEAIGNLVRPPQAETTKQGYAIKTERCQWNQCTDPYHCSGKRLKWGETVGLCESMAEDVKVGALAVMRHWKTPQAFKKDAGGTDFEKVVEFYRKLHSVLCGQDLKSIDVATAISLRSYLLKKS